MADETTEQDESRDESVSTARKVARTASFVVWMSFSGFFGLEVLEFGAAVDGLGYAHTSVPTLVTAGVGLVCLVIIGLLAVPVYRGTVGYFVAAGLGFGFWILSFIIGAWSLDYQYARVCDTMLAPRACEFVAKNHEDDCVPYAGSSCARALKRACTLGRASACDLAVEKGVLPQRQACNALADKCDEASRCGTANPPPACGGPDVPRLEDLDEERVCAAFEERCGEGE